MEMKMKMMVMMMMVVVVGSEVAEAATTEEKCGADFQKLTVCLTYATGKAETPSKDCCDSVKGIKDSEPECLCYIMQQAHKGNDKIKSLGIQETKLLALPSACAVKNATLTECPKLLGLSPNSPDAAIFTNASTAVPAASTTSAATGTGTSQSQNTKDASSVSTLVVGTHLVGLLAMAVSAIAFSAIP